MQSWPVYAGGLSNMTDDERRSEPKTWFSEVNRWLQAALVILSIFMVGLPIEHRLTVIETNSTATSGAMIEQGKAQKENNGLSLLSLQTNQTVLEILLKLRLPKDDKKKVEEKLAEIKAKKISRASNFAGDDVIPPE
jgi:hypothetical protein